MVNEGHACLVSMYACVPVYVCCVFLNRFLQFFAVLHSDKTRILCAIFCLVLQEKAGGRERKTHEENESSLSIK
jgi:hypothetical protein